MDAVGLLRNRVAAVGANTRSLISEADGLDWVTPVLPGTSPIGLTLWHLPRTVDWLVNTTVRDAAEVADSAEFGDLPDPDTYGFGTALTSEQASEAAGQVRSETLLAYADKVHRVADEWLATLSDSDLDEAVAGFLDRQRRRPAYYTDAALAEVQHLPVLPLGELLLRPAISHLLMHGGELDLLIQHAKR